MSTLVNGKYWFTRTNIIEAILFHLRDENWFESIPDGLEKWLDKLPKDKKVGVKKEDWEETKSGTQRMLWLMIASGVDPYELCKWAKTPCEAAAMHRRFSNIIQSWGGKD